MSLHISPKVDLENETVHWLEIAYAFLDSAIELNERMTQGNWTGSYYRGQSVMWLSFHATETFLKGCIKSHPRKTVGNVHSLGQLAILFNELYPNINFDPLFTVSMVSADYACKKLAEKWDKELHQELRYPISSKGSPWSTIRGFDPLLYHAQLAKARVDFDRVVSEVQKLTGTQLES